LRAVLHWDGTPIEALLLDLDDTIGAASAQRAKIERFDLARFCDVIVADGLPRRIGRSLRWSSR